MILTSCEENSAVATLQHQICIRDFKATCHLVVPGGWNVFLPGFCYGFGKKDVFQVQLGLLVRIFFFLAKLFDLVYLEKKLEK